MNRLAVLLIVLGCACSKAKEEPAAATGTTALSTGSGSAANPGSATGETPGSAAGSGSATASGSGSATGSGSGSGSAGSDAKSDFDFDKLTHQQQIDFMKTKVMPAMKTAFQEFDPKKYEKFTCKTCHGKDPQQSKYKMPNASLAKLDFAALKAGKQKPKMAEFMGKVVTPQMAKLLNQPEASESNPKGFGCLECHEQKK